MVPLYLMWCICNERNGCDVALKIENIRLGGIRDLFFHTLLLWVSAIVLEGGYQYETVSGFICEAFGYIPRTGERIKVVLAKANQEENDESKSDNRDQKEKHQIFKLEILAGNARKVSAVRFERINNGYEMLESKEMTRLFPKIIKRKWSGDEDSDSTEYDEDSFPRRPEDDLSNEHEEEHDNQSRH
ncbi:hypothetical protein F2P56_005545 [Juglans regia]|uniref:Transporter-associated domain-containing protein n=1 Tax=Juglans regia TaxID=51240 RepID=A0A833YCI6_JUGRE|nr:hypothetical protein F2P56_005545 [Juglans regia]